jgi:hypothetical protein
VVLGWFGCTTADVKTETVAVVNGDEIKVRDLRDILGIRGGSMPATQVSPEKKKEALDRLVAGRLLAQEARARGLDNTAEYKDMIAKNEKSILIAALFQKEMESKLKIDEKEVEAESMKLRAADKNLSEGDATFRSRQALSEARVRKLEEELIAAAKKETAFSVNQEMTQKIGKGGKVEDTEVLATVGAEKISYGEVKRLLQDVMPDSHGSKSGQDPSRNPMAIERMLDREIAGRTLFAYAKKQGIEGSEWTRSVRKELERSVLINLVADRMTQNETPVTEKEIGDAYAEHKQMFLRDGKKIPLSELKEQIRQFLVNQKRRKTLEGRIEELKKKAKITVNDALLPKV